MEIALALLDGFALLLAGENSADLDRLILEFGSLYALSGTEHMAVSMCVAGTAMPQVCCRMRDRPRAGCCWHCQ